MRFLNPGDAVRFKYWFNHGRDNVCYFFLDFLQYYTATQWKYIYSENTLSGTRWISDVMETVGFIF